MESWLLFQENLNIPWSAPVPNGGMCSCRAHIDSEKVCLFPPESGGWQWSALSLFPPQLTRIPLAGAGAVYLSPARAEKNIVSLLQSEPPGVHPRPAAVYKSSTRCCVNVTAASDAAAPLHSACLGKFIQNMHEIDIVNFCVSEAVLHFRDQKWRSEGEVQTCTEVAFHIAGAICFWSIIPTQTSALKVHSRSCPMASSSCCFFSCFGWICRFSL